MWIWVCGSGGRATEKGRGGFTWGVKGNSLRPRKHGPKLVQSGRPAQSGGGGWGYLVLEVRGVGWLDLKWKTSYIPLALSSRASPRGWAVEGMPQATFEPDPPSAEA